MKYLAGATFFGTIGWLVGQSVLERTGNDILAALIFGLTVAVMLWAGDLRRQMDD